MGTAKRADISLSYANKLWQLIDIKDAIRKRGKSSKDKRNIATRKDRQAFWTGVVNGTITSKKVLIAEDGTESEEIIQPKMSDRLKASELLGRSEADFTDKHEHSGKIEYDHIINPMSLKALKDAVEPLKKAINSDSEEPKLLTVIPKKAVNS